MAFAIALQCFRQRKRLRIILHFHRQAECLFEILSHWHAFASRYVRRAYEQTVRTAHQAGKSCAHGARVRHAHVRDLQEQVREYRRESAAGIRGKAFICLQREGIGIEPADGALGTADIETDDGRRHNVKR